MHRRFRPCLRIRVVPGGFRTPGAAGVPNPCSAQPAANGWCGRARALAIAFPRLRDSAAAETRCAWNALSRREQSFRLRCVDRALTGAAGEFFVAGELARRGWRPSITPRGVERTDVLAQHSESGRLVALQVKTATTTAFRLGRKDEQPAQAQNEWFVLVALREAKARPRYFVLPTDVVAGWLYVDHRVWLEGTKRDGTARKDTAIRVIRMHEIDVGYEEAWDLLNPSAHDAPVHVPDRILERGASDIGWPDRHPGLSTRH